MVAERSKNAPRERAEAVAHIQFETCRGGIEAVTEAQIRCVDLIKMGIRQGVDEDPDIQIGGIRPDCILEKLNDFVKLS